VKPSAKEEPMASRRSPDAPNPADPVKPVNPASVADPAMPAAAPGAGAPRARKAPPVAPAPTRAPAPARVQVTPEARRALIAENAYRRAERRGFEPGHETEDWLAAEVEVDALLRAEHGGSPQ
jgi:Protein of unknown function (DUF2934)